MKVASKAIRPIIILIHPALYDSCSLLERPLKNSILSSHLTLTSFSMMNLMKSFIVIVFDYFFFHLLVITVGSTSADSTSNCTGKSSSSDLASRHTNTLTKRSIHGAFDACDSTQAAPRAALHPDAPVVETPKQLDASETIELATPKGGFAEDPKSDDVCGKELMISNGLPSPTQVPPIHGSYRPGLSGSESQNSRGHFKACYEKHVQAQNSGPIPTSSLHQEIMLKNSVRELRVPFENLTKPTELSMSKTETRHSTLELLSNWTSMPTFHVKQFFGRMMNKIQLTRFKSLRNILHPVQDSTPIPTPNETELSDLRSNAPLGLNYVPVFKDGIILPNNLPKHKIVYMADMIRPNSAGLRQLRVNGQQWWDDWITHEKHHSPSNDDRPRSRLALLDYWNNIEEAKKNIPDKYSFVNPLPGRIETNFPLSEDGEIFHPLITGSTPVTRGDVIAKYSNLKDRAAEEESLIGKFTHHQEEEEMNNQDIGRPLGLETEDAKELLSLKDPGPVLKEVEMEPPPPSPIIEADEYNPTEMVRNQEKSASLKETGQERILPNEIEGARETQTDLLDMAKTNQLEQNHLTQKEEDIYPTRVFPNQPDKNDLDPQQTRIEFGNGSEVAYELPEKGTISSCNFLMKEPQPGSTADAEQNISPQVPAEVTLNSVYHPASKMEGKFALNDDEPSTSPLRKMEESVAEKHHNTAQEGGESLHFQNQGILEAQDQNLAHLLQNKHLNTGEKTQDNTEHNHQESESGVESPIQTKGSYDTSSDRTQEDGFFPRETAEALQKGSMEDHDNSLLIEPPTTFEHKVSPENPIIVDSKRDPIFHQNIQAEKADQQKFKPPLSPKDKDQPDLTMLTGWKDIPSHSEESRGLLGQSGVNQDDTSGSKSFPLVSQGRKSSISAPQVHNSPKSGKDNMDVLLPAFEGKKFGNGFTSPNSQQVEPKNLVENSDFTHPNGAKGSHPDSPKVTQSIEIPSLFPENLELPVKPEKKPNFNPHSDPPLQLPQNKSFSLAPQPSEDPKAGPAGRKTAGTNQPVNKESMEQSVLAPPIKPNQKASPFISSEQGSKLTRFRVKHGLSVFSPLRHSDSQYDLSMLKKSHNVPSQSTQSSESQMIQGKSVGLEDVPAGFEESIHTSQNKESQKSLIKHLPKGSKSEHTSTDLESAPNPPEKRGSVLFVLKSQAKDMLRIPQGLKPIIPRKRGVTPPVAEMHVDVSKPIKGVLAAFKKNHLPHSPSLSTVDGTPASARSSPRMGGVLKKDSPRGSPRKRVGFMNKDGTDSRNQVTRQKSKFYLEAIETAAGNKASGSPSGSETPVFKPPTVDVTPNSKKHLSRTKSAYSKVWSPRGGLDAFRKELERTYSAKNLVKPGISIKETSLHSKTSREKLRPLDLMISKTILERPSNTRPRPRVPYYRRKADIIGEKKRQRPFNKIETPRKPRSRDRDLYKNLPAIKRSDMRLYQAQEFVRRVRRLAWKKVAPVLLTQPNLKVYLAHQGSHLSINYVSQTM